MRSTFGTGTDTHNLRVEKDQEFYRVRADTTVLKARHVMLYEDEHRALNRRRGMARGAVTATLRRPRDVPLLSP